MTLLFSPLPLSLPLFLSSLLTSIFLNLSLCQRTSHSKRLWSVCTLGRPWRPVAGQSAPSLPFFLFPSPFNNAIVRYCGCGRPRDSLFCEQRTRKAEREAAERGKGEEGKDEAIAFKTHTHTHIYIHTHSQTHTFTDTHTHKHMRIYTLCSLFPSLPSDHLTLLIHPSLTHNPPSPTHSTAPTHPPFRPQIVFILADDLGPGDVAVYPNPTKLP